MSDASGGVNVTRELPPFNFDFDFGVYGVLGPGDLDADGDVDLTDLATLLANFGTPTGAAREDGDLDGDQDVDLDDLATLLANYGRTWP